MASAQPVGAEISNRSEPQQLLHPKHHLKANYTVPINISERQKVNYTPTKDTKRKSSLKNGALLHATPFSLKGTH